MNSQSSRPAPRAALALCAFAPLFAPQSSEKALVLPPPEMHDAKTPAPPRPVEEAPAVDGSHANIAEPTSAPGADRRAVGRGSLAGLDCSRVYFDEPGDGRIWAAANGYKASFGVEGATYIPFFGSRAPRSFPVAFELRTVRAGASDVHFDPHVAPSHAGERVVFDRGAVDEIYDLGPDAIEQSFLLEAPLAGEIVLDVAVHSDLARSHDAGGLVLAGELGSVRCTAAVAIDADGRRFDAPTTWNGAGLEIRLPAERVAEARFPLVVDPVFFAFNVNVDAGEDTFLSDVAYDHTALHWMAVYERVFSATDHDVYATVLTSGGSLLTTVTLDTTTAYWAAPKVANNNLANQFLCVAAVGDPSGGARIVRGRTRGSGQGGPLGPQFTISGPESGDKYNPDVGGDPLLIPPTYYCVVYQRDLSSSDRDVHARLVETDSTLLGATILVDNSGGTLDGAPTISKSDGVGPSALQDWSVVWTRFDSSFLYDVRGARIHWNGTLTTPSFAIATSTSSESSPSVSSPTTASPRRYLVTYTLGTLFGDPDIQARLYQGTTLVDSANLTALSGAPDAEAQGSSSTDSDGLQFLVANQEGDGGTSNYDIYVTTVTMVGNELAVSEGHENVATSSASETLPEVACMASSGGPGFLFFVIWQQQTAVGNGDIEGALVEPGPYTLFCNPGTNGVIACPCGNAPGGPNRGCSNSTTSGGAALTGAGDTGPDNVVLTASGMPSTALCIFSQGDALVSNGVAFGDGVRCAGGQLLRLATKTASGGTATYPQAGDPDITARAAALGAPIAQSDKRYYYTYYRDPAAFACAATFNTTNGLVIQW